MSLKTFRYFTIEQDDQIFNLYKPFRNQLRQFEVLDSLRVLWAFAGNYSSGNQLPADIEIPGGFNYSDEVSDRKYRGVFDHEIDFLSKEIIINCQKVASRENSLKYKRHLGKLVNYVRQILVEKIDLCQKDFQQDFFLSFNRLVHHQFPWQENTNRQSIIRYYKIFSDEKVNVLVKKITGLSTYEIFLIGFFYFSITSNQFENYLPSNSETRLITIEMLNLFFANYSISISNLKEAMIATQQINCNLFYTYNHLKEKPIIMEDDRFYCPIPMLLYWQITNGTYYKICNEPHFNNAFGNSFQNYVGEVLNYIVTNMAVANTKILPESSYNKNQNKTSDWIVVDKEAILFIECKTKRMRLDSKTEIDSTALEKDLHKLASFVVQIYITYMDYASGKYELKYDPGLIFVPLVVTLEDWFVAMNPTLKKIVHEEVEVLFEKEKIDKNLLVTNPYFIRSISDFEGAFQVICEIGIKEYFEKFEKNLLIEKTREFKYIELFQGEIKRLFLDKIDEAVKEEMK
ncbi:MAG: hypothetical protein Q8T03_01145 [Bacteroidota bacterium]|nr:hypothetical protein [Bacteroidota bacterium]